MGDDQDIPEDNGDFERVSGRISSEKPPPRFIQCQRDIPMLDKRKSKKRVREEGTPATEASQKQRKPRLAPNRTGEPAETMNEMDNYSSDGANITTRKDPEHPKPNNTDIPGQSHPTPADECIKCAGKMINLRHRAQQALVCTGRETDSLKQERDTLERENNRLKADIARLRASQRPSSTKNPAISRFSADELHNQKNEIKKLRGRLSGALDLFELMRPPRSCDDAFVSSTGFIYQQMETLSNYIAYTADSLCKIRGRHFKNKKMSDDLIHLIDQTIINTDLLASEPVSAFRALTFGFIQERVFHASEIWTDLHFDGLMTRQYQNILDQRISPETLEEYHRAAIHLTLSRNREFNEYFIPGYGEQLQFEFFNIMAPLVVYTKDMDRRLKRQARTLFGHALNLRASCYPHSGTRYQLVQFKPGHIYDPQIMQAEDECRAPISIPEDGGKRRIKACMHGLMKAYSVQETATGLSLIKELTQPFLLEGGIEGQIISDKAAVILE